MLFNSLTYIFFLTIVVFFYWILKNNYRIYFLTFASFIFYGFWNPIYLILIISISIIDYSLALKINNSKTKKNKLFYLTTSIIANVGVLIYFKYLYFFIVNLNFLGLGIDAESYNFILPLGISFFTFEAISYNVDIYRGHFKPEKNYIYYFCFIAFFPKLIAGPILRAKHLIPQLSKRLKFNLNNFEAGIQRILVGLFLKVVIVDNIAGYVDSGFLIDNSLLSAIDIWTLSFMFGIQIYLDFSAYSTIAIGSAKLFGINIPENFNFPYQAKNPREFWQKWHISLSDWIKDYLYVPLIKYFNISNGLTGFLGFHPRTIALIITWSIMGFWHGANWTFILWGLMHGLLILFFRFASQFWNYNEGSFNKIISHIITLCFVMLTWIPFRALSISDVFEKYYILFDLSNYFFLGMRENVYLVAFLLMLGIYISSFLKKFHFRNIENSNYRIIVNFLIGFLLVPLIIAFLRPTNQFIYFQF
tara:strand:- start:5296 stop:6720 length:1425 start_codon:yes stop_codon:yes gene_type:complete